MYSFLHSSQENPSFPVQNIKKVALIPVVPWQLSLKRIDIQNIPFYRWLKGASERPDHGLDFSFSKVEQPKQIQMPLFFRMGVCRALLLTYLLRKPPSCRATTQLSGVWSKAGVKPKAYLFKALHCYSSFPPVPVHFPIFLPYFPPSGGHILDSIHNTRSCKREYCSTGVEVAGLLASLVRYEGLAAAPPFSMFYLLIGAWYIT